MKDYYVTFDKTSVYLEIISFIILFLKHEEDTTDTHSALASREEQAASIPPEDEYILCDDTIHNDIIHYDYGTIHNNIIHHDYNTIYNTIINDIDYLDTASGADQVRHIGPMRVVA